MANVADASPAAAPLSVILLLVHIGRGRRCDLLRTAQEHPSYARMPKDGLDLFRGLMVAMPISCALWAIIIEAVAALPLSNTLLVIIIRAVV
jgi:hypothetical protein